MKNMAGWFVTLLLLLLLPSSLQLALGVQAAAAAAAQSSSSTTTTASGTHSRPRRHLQPGDGGDEMVVCLTVEQVASANAIEGYAGDSVFLAANGRVVVTGDPAVVLEYDVATATWSERAADLLRAVVGEAHALSADGTFLGAGFNATATTADGNATGGIVEVRVVQYSGAQTDAWNFVGGPIVSTTDDDGGFISEMEFSADGSVLAVGGSNNVVQVFQWEVSNRTWIQRGQDILGSQAGLENLAMSGDGSRVAFVGETAAVRVFEFDPQAGNWTQLGPSITGGVDFGHALAVSGDGRFVAISEANYDAESGPGLVQVYQISENRTSWEPRGPAVGGDPGSDDNAGSSVAISEDGSVLVVGANGNSGRVRIYTFDDDEGGAWQLQETLQVPLSGGRSRFGSAVALTPDGSFLAANTIFYGASVHVFALNYTCPTPALTSAPPSPSPSAAPSSAPTIRLTTAPSSSLFAGGVSQVKDTNASNGPSVGIFAAIGVGVALVIIISGFFLWKWNTRTAQNDKRSKNGDDDDAPSATNGADTAAESGSLHQPPASVVATPVESPGQLWPTRDRPQSASGNYPPNSTSSMRSYPEAQVQPLPYPLPDFKDQSRSVARQQEEGELPIATTIPAKDPPPTASVRRPTARTSVRQPTARTSARQPTANAYDI